MKTCNKCHKDLPLSEFAINKEKKDGLSTFCKECHRALSKIHYQQNKAKYLSKAKFHGQRTYAENRDKINKLKSTAGCLYCNEADPACLDFHHANNDKVFSISNRKYCSWKKLSAEIDKCEIVCSNCHRKLHAGRELRLRRPTR